MGTALCLGWMEHVTRVKYVTPDFNQIMTRQGQRLTQQQNQSSHQNRGSFVTIII